MDERVMQFRIGMFVIVAGLVLTMLLIWFGESPTLFREHRYLVVHFAQAPEISEGIPVRKSGIRIGEVVAIQFDERPDQPDGVLVTLSLESKFKLHAGSVPRIVRGLIGDVNIDMLPSASPEPLTTWPNPATALTAVIDGEVAPDPAHALTAATEAFQNVKGTLLAIEDAARGFSNITAKAEKLDEFLVSFRDMGNKVGVLAGRLDEVVAENQADFKPAVASLRAAAEKIDATLDPATQQAIRDTARQLASGSARLDSLLADVAPLAADLGGDTRRQPVTALGQTAFRLNKIASEVGLLSQYLSDGRGRLNTNGTLQKLLVEADLYNNLNGTAAGAGRVVSIAERAIGHFNRFAERIANDPGAISRGALSR